MNLEFLADMGRMNGRWRWAEKRGCSAALIRAANAAILYTLVQTCRSNDVDPQA